jgi:AcrR family transcriptional regulator
LSTERIVRTAVRIADAEGLDALSMRRVATELGTGAMSLYRYVDDRRQLEELVVSTVLGHVDVDVGAEAGAEWYERVAALLDEARRTIEAHPAAVPLVLTTRHMSPGALRWAEAMMTALDAAGFDGHQRVLAFRTLVSHLLGSVQYAHYGPLSGTGTAAIADLPAAEFPVLAATAAQARTMARDDEFRAGVATVLRGLGADIAEG